MLDNMFLRVYLFWQVAGKEVTHSYIPAVARASWKCLISVISGVKFFFTLIVPETARTVTPSRAQWIILKSHMWLCHNMEMQVEPRHGKMNPRPRHLSLPVEDSGPPSTPSPMPERLKGSLQVKEIKTSCKLDPRHSDCTKIWCFDYGK